MRLTVVLSTYNKPRWLEKALHGYAAQTTRDFDIVVADDGSGPETAAVIARMKRDHALRLTHVWQEDRGFRKCEILDKAILATEVDYLIFSDGDCIPRADFVATHMQLAEPNHFLSGGAMWLDQSLSDRVTPDDIHSGRIAEPAWLRAHGWRGGRRRLRLTRSRRLARLLDTLTTTPASFNGHNVSAWRADLLKVNGFDLGMGYGGEDRAVGDLLSNIGVRGRQVRFRAIVFHLDHDRPYRHAEVMRSNTQVRCDIARHGKTRAPAGIAEVEQALATAPAHARPAS